MRNARTIRLAVATSLLAGAAATVVAAGPGEVVEYRQAMMKANGAHMAAAEAIISGKVGFKSDLAEHARALRVINRDLPALFPKGSGVGETSALEEVWKNGDEFRKRAADAARKSEALARAVAAGDAKSQAARFEELSDACRACHKDFRKPMM